jgi:hypothetical protein
MHTVSTVLLRSGAQPYSRSLIYAALARHGASRNLLDWERDLNVCIRPAHNSSRYLRPANFIAIQHLVDAPMTDAFLIKGTAQVLHISLDPQDLLFVEPGITPPHPTELP